MSQEIENNLTVFIIALQWVLVIIHFGINIRMPWYITASPILFVLGNVLVSFIFKLIGNVVGGSE